MLPSFHTFVAYSYTRLIFFEEEFAKNTYQSVCEYFQVILTSRICSGTCFKILMRSISCAYWQRGPFTCNIISKSVMHLHTYLCICTFKCTKFNNTTIQIPRHVMHAHKSVNHQYTRVECAFLLQPFVCVLLLIRMSLLQFT